MLAGLIFATEDADDRPGMLGATLPFGGLTLIEFQARLVIAAGASHVILVVARMTPELLGAISRIGRRGVSIDAVRTAAEVVDKLHPLARVIVVADGVVTTGDTVSSLAALPAETLLVLEDADERYERIGALTHWAGLAIIEGKRIAEVAKMPRDYDFQSTLLRVSAQGGAEQFRLASAARGSHSIERGSQGLAARGNVTFASLVARPIRWADRFLIAPVVQRALPLFMTRVVPTSAVASVAVATGLAGPLVIYEGWPVLGLLLTCVATLISATAASLAWIRDDERSSSMFVHLQPAIAAVTVLAVGTISAEPASWVLAGGTVVIGALVERAADLRHQRRWWWSPAASLPLILVLLPTAGPLVALATTGIYATITLAVAIETLREKP